MKFDLRFKPMNPTRRVTRPNEAWAADFMALDFPDRPSVMLVADVGTRRPLSATVSVVVVQDIIATLERRVRRSGRPDEIWMEGNLAYNSPLGDFHPAVRSWAKQHRIRLTHDPMLRTSRVSDRLFRELTAFLHDKQFPTLIELGQDIERWRQSYTVAAIPNVNQQEEYTMIIMMSERRMKQMTKRLHKVLRGVGVELKHSACLELAARLCGFKDWYTYLRRDPEKPLSLLDEELPDEDFAARDAFQMAVLHAAGLGEVARELLDRANPTGSWARQSTEEPAWEATAGNDPL
ncbi:glyoxalase superfamily protein [Bradyrhizobium sp. STM 3562]|uniref:glyoxalase superfamily protein n=1 Tax=Bradyrhizobium sp. STM 3562 TaxID=578924 RepID=UPI00388E049D